MRKGDRVRGEVGVFGAQAREGVVIGVRNAVEKGRPIELAGVKIDGEAFPLWVPSSALTVKK